MAILDPDPDCPARAVADRHIVASYDEVAAAVELGGGVSVVTCDLEHVSLAVVEALDATLTAARALLPVRPGVFAVASTQNDRASSASRPQAGCSSESAGAHAGCVGVSHGHQAQRQLRLRH